MPSIVGLLFLLYLLLSFDAGLMLGFAIGGFGIPEIGCGWKPLPIGW